MRQWSLTFNKPRWQWESSLRCSFSFELTLSIALLLEYISFHSLLSRGIEQNLRYSQKGLIQTTFNVHWCRREHLVLPALCGQTYFMPFFLSCPMSKSGKLAWQCGMPVASREYLPSWLFGPSFLSSPFPSQGKGVRGYERRF
jgi:hypothetical protein